MVVMASVTGEVWMEPNWMRSSDNDGGMNLARMKCLRGC